MNWYFFSLWQIVFLLSILFFYLPFFIGVDLEWPKTYFEMEDIDFEIISQCGEDKKEILPNLDTNGVPYLLNKTRFPRLNTNFQFNSIEV